MTDKMNPISQDAPASELPLPAQPTKDAFPMPRLLRGAEALRSAANPAEWLWHGYLAAGAVTLLTSRWKAGKTTLISVLLARLKNGGEFAGRSLAAARAIVVTEEGPEHWQRRHQQLAFGDHVSWFCRPFHGRPTPAQWSGFVAGLAELHAHDPFALLVIDPLAGFLPGNENSAASMLDALLPLQRLTERNVAVLVLHHPRKGDPPAGEAARGSGALSGFADILIEMRAPHPGREGDRRRRLWAMSRFPQTPQSQVIEWSTDGADYIAHGSFLDDEMVRHWKSLHAVFARAPHKLTRADLCRRWLHGKPPNRITLKRWLEKAVLKGMLRKDGEGMKFKPFRYWLPESEAAWREDPFAQMLMPEFRPPTPDIAEEPPSAPAAVDPAPTPPPEPPAPAVPAAPPEPAAESPAPASAELRASLPYPWNSARPEDVPEWAWKQARSKLARSAQRKT